MSSPARAPLSARTQASAREPGLERYEELHALAERELELAGRGELGEIEALGNHWQSLSAALPERPPREARALLERASLLHERSRVELLRLREALLGELEQLGKASRAAQGYVPASGPRRAVLDRRA